MDIENVDIGSTQPLQACFEAEPQGFYIITEIISMIKGFATERRVGVLN